MTSLEQEESKGGDSISDYDDSWETENWGDMDTAGGAVRTAASGHTFKTQPKGTDGWDAEEWGSLEEEVVSWSCFGIACKGYLSGTNGSKALAELQSLVKCYLAVESLKIDHLAL